MNRHMQLLPMSALRDRVLEILTVRAVPMTTPEMEWALGRPRADEPNTYLETRWADAYKALKSLHSKGLVDRMKSPTSGVVLWWAHSTIGGPR